MTFAEQFPSLNRYDDDYLFTGALQLMRRIYDQVVYGDERAVHADLPAAIEDLCTGPWTELDTPLVGEMPYEAQCRLLEVLLQLLELRCAGGGPGQEAVVTARWWLQAPGRQPFWVSG